MLGSYLGVVWGYIRVIGYSKIILGVDWGYMRVILGPCWGDIRVKLGLSSSKTA